VGEGDFDVVAGADKGGGFGGFAIDEDCAQVAEFLEHGAGMIGEAVAEVDVDAFLKIVVDVEFELLKDFLGLGIDDLGGVNVGGSICGGKFFGRNGGGLGHEVDYKGESRMINDEANLNEEAGNDETEDSAVRPCRATH
jgi:hypothetical protein